MPNNKSPGSDGLSVEFYKCFWVDIKKLMIDSLNEGYLINELSETQKQGILILLYKKGDKRLLDNWRPISLLNIDYKIAAKVLCKRLQNVLTTIISTDQTGYRKFRSAAENIRLVEDVIDYCEHFNIEGILLFLDFKKAFDNVDHELLFQLMHRFNFKDSFIRWIKVLYNKATGKVINHGWVTQAFKIEQGVRQGCPLSALLFLLVAEVLTQKIKQNFDIKGITVPNTLHINQEQLYEVKISQLADDTVVFVNSIKSGNIALKEIESFGKIAGPKLNLAKTNVITIFPQNECLQDLNWTTDPVKYLGIYISRNKGITEQMNWDNKLKKIQNVINMWKHRNLTLYGKVVVLKSLVVSQIVYLATALYVPKTFIQSLEKTMYNFLWGSKREKVKRSICINSVEQGGLDMIDLKSKLQSLKLSWITKYLKNRHLPWMFLFAFWIEKIGPIPLCFKFNCSSKDMLLLCNKKQLPLFYKDLLISWCEIRFNDIDHIKKGNSEILWYNSNIKFKKELLYFKEWITKDIIYTHQLFRNGQWKPILTIYEMLNCNSLLINFMYLKLKHALPLKWQDECKQNNSNINTFENNCFEVRGGESINLIKTKTKEFYTLSLNYRKTEPLILVYWQHKLFLPNDFCWNPVLQFKMKSIKHNKIRQFNFKLIQNILPFKVNLYRWRIETDTLCMFCEEEETVKHIMLQCSCVLNFWTKVCHLIYKMFKIRIHIDERTIYIGYKIDEKKFSLLNLLIIFAQYAIYKAYMLYKMQRKPFNEFFIWSVFKDEILFYVNWQLKNNVNTVNLFNLNLK